jgi:hypothetical protein
MNPSNPPESGPTPAEWAAQLCVELCRLRDALVSLSIHLKDWQCELDPIGQRQAQAIVTETLQRLSLQRRAATGSNESSRSSASKS